MKKFKAVFLTVFIMFSILLCSCSGYASQNGVNKKIVGTWIEPFNNQKVEISNSGARLTNVMQIEPINVNGEEVIDNDSVDDIVFLSTPIFWDFYYDGSSYSANFETTYDIVCFTEMEWKDEAHTKIGYDKRYLVKFDGYISGRVRELVFYRGSRFDKVS